MRARGGARDLAVLLAVCGRHLGLVRGAGVLGAADGVRDGPLHLDAALHVASAAVQQALPELEPHHPLAARTLLRANPEHLLCPPHGHASPRRKFAGRLELDDALHPQSHHALAALLPAVPVDRAARTVRILLPTQELEAGPPCAGW